MSNTVLYWELLFCNDDFDSFQAEIINFTDQMLKNFNFRSVHYTNQTLQMFT